MNDRPIRLLVAEDEGPARRRMRSLLAAFPEVAIVAEAEHGGQAVELIEKLKPDLVLLDVQLPVASGFEVIDAIGASAMPPVIFVTAYDRYAIRAFEVHALDYLLKPVDPARLASALDRAKSKLKDSAAANSQMDSVIDEVRRAAALKRLPVRHAGRILFIDIADIDYVLADGNYVRVRARGSDYLLRDTLTAFEARLKPPGFLRIHRRALVQTDRIIELQPLFHGEYSVKLRDGSKLVSGRTYRESVRAAFSLRDYI